MKAQVKALREQIKKIREQKNQILEQRKAQRDTVKTVLSASKKQIKQGDLEARKAERLRVKQEKAQAAATKRAGKKKKYHEHTTPDLDGLYRDENYFTTLSSMVNNDFIKKIQNGSD